MALLNLNSCDKECITCIKNYKKKFNLQAGDKFKIVCEGIPKEYLNESLLDSLTDEERSTALSVLDPVTWAADMLDWHCIDPDGEIWKRKDYNEWLKWRLNHPDEDILGHSRYHRPYQEKILKCTSQQKILLMGRQLGKTDVIAVMMLYYAITKPNKAEDKGFDIIIITPFQAQIELIFKRIQELLGNSKSLQNCVLRSVKAPNYTIEFHNHSQIRGFTAGTQSGGNANAVRGQHGDMLIYDEADMLSSGDLDSSLSILTNSPNALLVMSSTPTGKRERFYQNCYDRQYRLFHYPSQANPLWNPQLEQRFKDQLTSIGYQHEVLAQFGEQEQGVFQNQFVLAAKAKYNYGQYKYDASWVYTIGVDWNDTKIGSTICVLGYDPLNNHFYLVDRAVVSREGWTQLAACEKIAELNRIWHPTAIYIDRGFGHMQEEVLKKFGYDALANKDKGPLHPDAKLRNIVHSYEFGSKIEVHDLFTGQPIDKPAKPFLVESTIRRFETYEISFPESDTILEKQLNSYVIDHITSTGTPTYKSTDTLNGDHVLDALMLSVVAFTLEKTPIGKPVNETHITFSGALGEKINTNEDSLVMKPDRKYMQQKKRDQSRPSAQRADIFYDKPLISSFNKQLPANHLNTGYNKNKLWSWPGFLRDDPPPTSPIKRSLFKSSPPKRKNI